MGLFSSKSKSKSRTQLEPYKYAGPGIGTAAHELSFYSRKPWEFFPGQTYAGQTPEEQQALQQLTGAAGALPEQYQGLMQPAFGAYQQALGAPQSVLGMGLQDVVNNPALAGAAEAIQARVNRNLQENIMPQLTATAVGRGALGGTRQQVSEALAARGTQDVLSEQLANMYGQAWGQGLGAETARYGQALQAQAGAMGRLPSLMGAAYTGATQPATLLQSVGATKRAEQQRAIDEQMARHQFAQTEPLQRLGASLDLLMPLGQAFGASESRSVQRASPSLASQIGQIGALGAGLIGAMPGLGSMGAGLFGRGAAQPAQTAQAAQMYNPWSFVSPQFSPGRFGY